MIKQEDMNLYSNKLHHFRIRYIMITIKTIQNYTRKIIIRAFWSYHFNFAYYVNFILSDYNSEGNDDLLYKSLLRLII